MAKSTKKSTRKFEKNHLKDTIERRKAGAKIKQKQQIKEKKKLRTARDAEFLGREDGKSGGPSKEVTLEQMTVDDFFQGGFEIPEKVKSKTELGKRKRTVPEEDEDDESEKDHGMSKEAMEALQEKDPEFYHFLKDNDPEALDFDEADLSESEEDQPTKKRKKSDANDTEVTKAMLTKWKEAMTEQHSLRAMRQVVLAFKAAAYVNEEDAKSYKYTISSPEVYHDLLILTLDHVIDVLNHHLPVKETASGKARVSMDTKKFKTLTPLLKSHISSVHHLLTTLSDASTLKTTLSALTPLLPYLLSFKKILKNVVKTVVGIWSDTSNTEATRITAFLVIRRLAVIGDSGIREAVFKTVYQGLLAGSRGTTVHSIQGINLMKNSAAELWGIDQLIGYTTGFTFIRQLAIHLRGSITDNSKESYKTVYNWQYIHSLDFWSCVLSEHCSPLKEAAAGKESQLRPLIYPTVQVTLGAMRLIPTATYFPLRFHLIRSLLRLSRATGTYIPLASVLLEVLSSAEMKRAPKPSTLKPFDFNTNYKCQKAYLRTRVYQDAIGEQVVELLSEFFVLWSTSIAFPELALPVVVMLKRWLKEKAAGNRKVNGQLSLFVQKLEANARWIEEKRAKVDFAPNNRAGVEGFLKGFAWEGTPMGAFVAGQRGQREEKRKLIERGRREEERKRAEEKAKARAGDDEMEEDDMEEDEMEGDEMEQDEMAEDEMEEDEMEDDEMEDDAMEEKNDEEDDEDSE